ncbi:CaiB/BaiF CoA-transferase family protein [Hydrogenophaga sp.]|uniref:CaiB/BaiF CoA transferase family protein n=1 Tax=Hydrogenophaga sp. TaxID=1904254 RepID=UPI0027229A29|nr:CaiB/BaiF CoA-transferase family protein [Hydrogenophaga sp.]MDO9437520.1 CaiB/BaiF CoA-transferase family protein [Hydrogenophaga sp.]
MGPLHGVKVVELAGIGPGPMAAMLLADMGATVLRVDRQNPSGLGVQRPEKFDLLLRSRSAVAVDLKSPAGVDFVLDLVGQADVLIEGFRPGVTERLGLGPDACLARNPKLVYGRITGWGQNGPMAQDVGHDLNYIALTGALHAIGRAGQPPAIPINLVGDFGGGTLYLVMGVLAALFEAQRSGRGQVVDAAMVDGVANLMTQPHGTFAAGMMNNQRGTNITDSGAPFYDVYACSDGRYVTLAAVESKFYSEALRVLGLPDLLAGQWDRAQWPDAKLRIAAVFATRTRDAWCAAFEGTESCFAPVLSIDEAPQHPHLRERGTYVEVAGVTQPAPAPRFSATPSAAPTPFVPWRADAAVDILQDWMAPEAVSAALKTGVIG